MCLIIRGGCTTRSRMMPTYLVQVYTPTLSIRSFIKLYHVPTPPSENLIEQQCVLPKNKVREKASLRIVN